MNIFLKKKKKISILSPLEQDHAGQVTNLVLRLTHRFPVQFNTMIRSIPITIPWRVYCRFCLLCFGRILHLNVLRFITRTWNMNYMTAELPLTLNVRGPSYLGLVRSISWLLMPWLLASPGHQPPWYWRCKICKSQSCTRKDFNYLWHVSVEEWHTCLCSLWKI